MLRVKSCKFGFWEVGIGRIKTQPALDDRVLCVRMRSVSEKCKVCLIQFLMILLQIIYFLFLCLLTDKTQPSRYLPSYLEKSLTCNVLNSYQ